MRLGLATLSRVSYTLPRATTAACRAGRVHALRPACLHAALPRTARLLCTTADASCPICGRATRLCDPRVCGKRPPSPKPAAGGSSPPQPPAGDGAMTAKHGGSGTGKVLSHDEAAARVAHKAAKRAAKKKKRKAASGGGGGAGSGSGGGDRRAAAITAAAVTKEGLAVQVEQLLLDRRRLEREVSKAKARAAGFERQLQVTLAAARRRATLPPAAPPSTPSCESRGVIRSGTDDRVQMTKLWRPRN